MWNALNRSDGAELFDELKTLGFEKLELSRHLTPDQVEHLKPYLRENPPCSIHNFCPILPGTSQATAEQEKIFTLQPERGTKRARGGSTHNPNDGTCR